PALGRCRLVAPRRACGRGEPGDAAHVLDRVRGALVQRAWGRAPCRGAVRHPAPGAPVATRRSAAPAGAGGCIRRTVRGFVCVADLPRLAARSVGCEGRALRRGRRRALRRLLHLCGGPARRQGGRARTRRAAARRAPAELEREGELRLPREAIRPRSAPAAARAAPRVEGDLLA